MLFAVLPLSLLAWEADLYARYVLCFRSLRWLGKRICMLFAVLRLSLLAREADFYPCLLALVET